MEAVVEEVEMVEVVVKVVVVVVVVVGSGTAGYPDFEDVGAARFLWLDGACRGLPRQLWHAGASVACGGLTAVRTHA